ncbi:MAG: DNA topoisomerase IB [Burkholderiaceae bacterium]
MDLRGRERPPASDGPGRARPQAIRYHPLWQQQRGDDKFAAMRQFGAVLPRIRRRVQRDLADPATARPTRTLVLAALVRLLDTTFLRVGNEEYAHGNGSYGLTTLRVRHAGVRDAEVRLSFKGKSGVRQEVALDDRRVAAVVRRCKALPGQELFQYCDPDGGTHKLTSADVNDYLAEIAGVRVTAKDFRTWHGSALALEFTRVACAGDGGRSAAAHVIAQVAARLGNTAAVCRKSYIHPAVLSLGAALADPDARTALLKQPWAGAGRARGGPLSAAERRLTALLKSSLPRRANGRPGQGAPEADGSAICRRARNPPTDDGARRKATSHAKDFGIHDAQRAGRPPRRDPAARRASDG